MTIPAYPILSAPAGEKADLRPSGCFAAKGSCIRRLKAEDASILVAHLKRLDGEARRLRFGETTGDSPLAGHAARTLSDTGLAKGLFVDGVLRGLGELRLAAPSGEEAEAIFSVEPDFRERGHGAQLFESLLGAARERGVRRLLVPHLRDSQRMREMAARFGAEVSFPFADTAPDPHSQIPAAKGCAYALIDWPEERRAPILDTMRRLTAVFRPLPLRT